MARAIVVTGGAVTTKATAKTDQKHWANKSQRRSSGWSSSVSLAGYYSISSASGVKALQVPEVLAVTDQAGEGAVGVGAEMMAMMTHPLLTITRDGHRKALTAQINLKVGDLDHGLPH